MKLKRFVAKDMKIALSMVKDELGPNAIIMSNRRVDAGIEIVAGVEEIVTTLPNAEKTNTLPNNFAPIADRVDKSQDEVTLSSQKKLDNSLNKLKHASNLAKASANYDNGSYINGNLRGQYATNNHLSSLGPAVSPRTSGLSPEQKAQGLDALSSLSHKLGLDSNGAHLNKSQTLAKSLIDILERQQKQSQSQSQAPIAAQPNVNNSNNPSNIAANNINNQQNAADNVDEAPAPIYQDEALKGLFAKTEQKLQQQTIQQNSNSVANTNDVALNNQTIEQASALLEVKDEVAVIRRLLQFELAGFLQESKSRQEPVKAMVDKLLLSAGFSHKVAEQLTKSVNQDASFNFAWREVADILEKSITVGSDEIIKEGGIVTLVGPAGVGKTTTLAKLAARFVMKYGAERVAIISSDNYRIGAVEQVKTYGRIMGCTTLAIKSINELPELLYTLKDKSLILIDTAGVGLKDERFETQLAQLKIHSALKLKHYLVMTSTAQRRVLQQVYNNFKSVGLAGVILTKIDESQSLGDALSLCVEENLKISYITDGQRVPEDLTLPTARNLAIKALSSVEDDAVASAIS